MLESGRAEALRRRHRYNRYLACMVQFFGRDFLSSSVLLQLARYSVSVNPKVKTCPWSLGSLVFRPKNLFFGVLVKFLQQLF